MIPNFEYIIKDNDFMNKKSLCLKEKMNCFIFNSGDMIRWSVQKKM